MAVGIEDRLEAMLGRLKLSAIRERLDNLLDDAGRRELSLREGLILLCEAEVWPAAGSMDTQFSLSWPSARTPSG